MINHTLYTLCTAKNNVTTFYWEWFTAYCVGTDGFTTSDLHVVKQGLESYANYLNRETFILDVQQHNYCNGYVLFFV